jgi:L-ascorbate metabolism protein UlaG (beta-lactamase superfamily)
MPNGIVVGTDGLAPVYHAGDTDVFGDMKLIARLFAPKVCILPIGDYFTMAAEGAALAAEMLDPTTIVPLHYKTFPVLAPSTNAFREALPANLRERLLVAEIGQELAWDKDGARTL